MTLPIKMRQPLRILGVLFSLVGVLCALPVGTPCPAAAAELTFTGKLVCSLKRPVILPVAGQITSLMVEPGKKVSEGEILGRYQLVPESIQALRRRLSPAQLPEMRAKLADIDKNLTILKNKQKSLQELTSQKLAAPQSLEQVQQEIQALANLARISGSWAGLSRRRSAWMDSGTSW